MKIFSVASWNVNSIRSRIDQFNEILKLNNLDILMLQETKVQDIHFPKNIFDDKNYNIIFHGQKSYNGVAIASKFPITFESKSLPSYNLDDNDTEARYIEGSITVDGKFYTLINAYVPNGDSNEDGELEQRKRFKYKINFYKRLQKRLQEFDKNDNVIIAGDFNVAKDEIDLTAPKRNEGDIGFHPEERENLKELERLGFYDLFRFKYPEKQLFTWWDHKTRAFERNSGWRLDYIFGSENVKTNLNDVKILTEARGMKKPSDHTLVIAEIKI